MNDTYTSQRLEYINAYQFKDKRNTQAFYAIAILALIIGIMS